MKQILALTLAPLLAGFAWGQPSANTTTPIKPVVVICLTVTDSAGKTATDSTTITYLGR